MVNQEKQTKVAVYGCGNMSQALIEGIHAHNKNIEFHTYTPSYIRAEELAQKVSGHAWKELNDIPACDYYLIACKPQQVKDLAQSLEGVLPENQVIISILAGTTVDQLKDLFKTEKVIRIMPNTPSLVGEGANLLFSSPETGNEQVQFIEEQLKFISKVFNLNEESEIDNYVAISGSGPAYIFEIARILSLHAQEEGMSKDDARLMANQMIFGSAKLLLESEDDAETLRNKVTSKGGVTFEALETLKEYKLEEAFKTALDRAKNRSIELGK